MNRELARIASEGDPQLADRLLSACGMDPATGHIVPDSLLAAGNTRQIADGLVAAGSPVDAVELTIKLDELFSHAAEFSVRRDGSVGVFPAPCPRLSPRHSVERQRALDSADGAALRLRRVRGLRGRLR